MHKNIFMMLEIYQSQYVVHTGISDFHLLMKFFNDFIYLIKKNFGKSLLMFICFDGSSFHAFSVPLFVLLVTESLIIKSSHVGKKLSIRKLLHKPS